MEVMISVQPSHQQNFQELHKSLEKVFFDKVAIESAIILLVVFFFLLKELSKRM